MYQFMVLTNQDIDTMVKGHIREHESALFNAQVSYLATGNEDFNRVVQRELEALSRLREHFFATPEPPVEGEGDGTSPSTGTSET